MLGAALRSARAIGLGRGSVFSRGEVQRSAGAERPGTGRAAPGLVAGLAGGPACRRYGLGVVSRRAVSVQPQHRPVAGDLLVILGGGLGERARTGADLYRDGFAPRILLTGIAETGVTAASPEPFFRLPYLRFRGVPPEAMILDSAVDSTWEEAWLIRKLCLEHHWRTVLVVSDPPHFRRLSWSLVSATAGTDIDWRLVPAQSPWWNAGSWWDNPRAVEFVGKEVFKSAFYLFRYGAGLGTG